MPPRKEDDKEKDEEDEEKKEEDEEKDEEDAEKKVEDEEKDEEEAEKKEEDGKKDKEDEETDEEKDEAVDPQRGRLTLRLGCVFKCGNIIVQPTAVYLVMSKPFQLRFVRRIALVL